MYIIFTLSSQEVYFFFNLKRKTLLILEYVLSKQIMFLQSMYTPSTYNLYKAVQLCEKIWANKIMELTSDLYSRNRQAKVFKRDFHADAYGVIYYILLLFAFISFNQKRSDLCMRPLMFIKKKKLWLLQRKKLFYNFIFLYYIMWYILSEAITSFLNDKKIPFSIFLTPPFFLFRSDILLGWTQCSKNHIFYVK